MVASWHRVDADGVVAEQRALLVRREVGDDVAEAAEDRREASRTGCRPGSCSRTCSAPTPKRSIIVRTMSRFAADGPRLRRAGRGPRSSRATFGHAASVAIARFQPARPSALRSAGRPVWLRMIVVSGKSRGEARRFAQVPPRRLQVEAQAVARELGEAGAPRAIGHAAGRRIAGRRDSRAACAARCARTRTPPAARARAARRRASSHACATATRRQSVLAAQRLRRSASRRPDRADPIRPRRRPVFSTRNGAASAR